MASLVPYAAPVVGHFGGRVARGLVDRAANYVVNYGGGRKRRRNNVLGVFPPRAPMYRSLQAGRDREIKFFDTSITDSDISNQVQEASLVLIPAGTGESQRNGRKITVKRVSLRLIFGLDGASPAANANIYNALIRVILYVDNQCNGATAAVTDVLEASGVDSFYNLNNVPSRFRILHDKTYKISAGGGDGTDMFGNHYLKTISKAMNVPIDFDSTTGAITELCCKNIGMLTLKFDTGGNATVNLNGKARVRYSDG